MRLNRKISDKTIDLLKDCFMIYLMEVKLNKGVLLEQEILRSEYTDLPRLIFKVKDRDYGLLKMMIDEINKDGLFDEQALLKLFFKLRKVYKT